MSKKLDAQADQAIRVGDSSTRVADSAPPSEPATEKPRLHRNVSASLLTLDDGAPFVAGTLSPRPLTDAELERFAEASRAVGQVLIVEGGN